MITQDDLATLVRQLLGKSRLNQVKWKREEEDMSGGEFLAVRLPKSMIRLLHRSPPTEPDFIAFQLCNRDGIPVGQIKVEEGDDRWSLVNDLYEEAIRYATRWDEVLEDVRRSLGSGGEIGS